VHVWGEGVSLLLDDATSSVSGFATAKEVSKRAKLRQPYLS